MVNKIDSKLLALLIIVIAAVVVLIAMGKLPADEFKGLAVVFFAWLTQSPIGGIVGAPTGNKDDTIKELSK